MALKDIFVYGTGGHGKEVASIIDAINASGQYNFLGFIDQQKKEPQNNKKVFLLEEICKSKNGSRVAIAVGSSLLRKKILQECLSYGLTPETIIHPSAQVSSYTEIGIGCIVFPGTILSVNVTLGDFVNINSNCSISHDSQIGSFTTISPGVNICGNVHIGENVFIGAGATVIDGASDSPIEIAANVVIGAGACVINSITSPGTYCGVPATKR